MPYQLTWNGDNEVNGNEIVPTRVNRDIFEDLNARHWSADALPLVTALWEQYKRSVDNFWYQVDEYGEDGDVTVNSDTNGLIWACGQVYGASRALRDLVAPGHDVIPDEVRAVTEKYQV